MLRDQVARVVKASSSFGALRGSTVQRAAWPRGLLSLCSTEQVSGRRVAFLNMASSWDSRLTSSKNTCSLMCISGWRRKIYLFKWSHSSCQSPWIVYNGSNYIKISQGRNVLGYSGLKSSTAVILTAFQKKCRHLSSPAYKLLFRLWERILVTRSGRMICQTDGSATRVACLFHISPSMWDGASKRGSVTPIEPLDVVPWQHIAVSTDRAVNTCSVVAVESAGLPAFDRSLHKRSTSPFMDHPTCKRPGLGSIGQQFGDVWVWQITVSYSKNLGSFKVTSAQNSSFRQSWHPLGCARKGLFELQPYPRPASPALNWLYS